MVLFNLYTLDSGTYTVNYTVYIVCNSVQLAPIHFNV